MKERVVKYSFLILLSALVPLFLKAQPAGYYSAAENLTGTMLQQTLHDIIKNHTVLSYSSLWTQFQGTDKKSDGTVWDMYSDIPAGTPVYSYSFITNQCGNYSGEGSCYNREHSFPNSWFGGEVFPMYTDLFHLYPTDGYVNGQRGSYPFGITSVPTWTSTNGSKLGLCSYSGYTGIIFEPINAYKGDFARTYFYMAVRYYGEDSLWPGSDMVTGSQLKTWALKMLMEWDLNDPVSLKEKDRNDAVYSIQGNRNPFIDNPGYVNLIWGNQSGLNDISSNSKILRAWPNPAKESVTIELPDRFSDFLIKILDVSGKTLLNKTVSGQSVMLDVANLETGLYILILSDEKEVLTTRIIVSH